MEPQFQFRGVWVPADVLILFKEKKISGTELTFLSIVEGLTPPRSNGCWATNAYLSDMMGVHKRTISEMIAKLREMRLVKTLHKKNQRFIQTTYGGGMPSPAWGDAPPGMGRSITKVIELDNIEEKGSLRGEGSKMAQFRPSTKEENFSEFDLSIADGLHETIVQKIKIHRPWSYKKWANEIRLLRKDLDGDKERLLRVFQWWVDNCKAKGLPTVINAIQFRKHFAWIEGKCEKDIGKIVAVDEETKSIAKRVVMLGWPGTTRDQVSAAIQIGKDNLNKLIPILQKIIKEQPRTVYTYFVKNVRDQIGDPRHFVEQWMRKIHAQYASWEDWNQDLVAESFHPDHKIFRKMGKNWASAYASDVRLFDQLIKEVNAVWK